MDSETWIIITKNDKFSICESQKMDIICEEALLPNCIWASDTLIGPIILVLN